MTDWYASSVAYATYTAFQTSHAYVIGDLIVPTAPTVGAKYVLRCTTAGTSSTEPSWTSTVNGTNTSGTAVFTNITGQGFFWAAAAGDVATLLRPGSPKVIQGDRVFISSDHTETSTTGLNTLGSSFETGFGLIQWLSVNRAGSTPPGAADLQAGATIIGNNTAGQNALSIRVGCQSYHYGITYSVTSGNLDFGQAAVVNGRSIYFDNCQLWLNQSISSAIITATVSCTVILNNSTLEFGHIGQTIAIGLTAQFDMIWQNTPSNALAGSTFPSVLFNPFNTGVGIQTNITCRGVDLSNISGSLVTNALGGSKYLFESCKIASGVTRYNTTSISANHELVELVNCYDGTNFINEFHVAAGDVTTEFTITLSGGATDNVGTFSHKMVTSANTNKFVSPLAGFWLDCEYTTTGSPKTATVEIISSASVNNDDIALYLEYEGTAGSSVASFADCFAGPLVIPSPVPTSTATWNAAPAVTGNGGYASSVFTNTVGTTGSAGVSSIFLTKVTLANAQTVAAVLLNVSADTSVNLKALIYDGSHSALLATGSTVASVTAGVNRLPLTANASLAAGTYYVGYVASATLNVFVDSTQTSSSWFVSGGQSVSSPANPLSGGVSSNNALQIALEFVNAAQTSAWGPDYSANVALSGSNAIATFSSSGATGVRSAVGAAGGRYYAEVLIGGTVDSTCFIAVQAACMPANGSSSDVACATYNQAGSFGGTGVVTSGSPPSWTSGDVIGIAFNSITQQVWFNKNNGAWFGGSSPDPANGVGGITFTLLSTWPAMIAAERASGSTAAVFTLHDTAASQTYSAPSGFVAWASSATQQRKLQVTFTPQHAGRVRGQVRLGKASATVYVNPQITIT